MDVATAALLAGLVGSANICPIAVDVLDNGVCMAPPPPGTGLRDGRGWVHCMQPGLYIFHGGAVNGDTAPKKTWCGLDEAQGRGRFSLIQQFNSRLEWTRPDGRREQIPTTALYPPM